MNEFSFIVHVSQNTTVSLLREKPVIVLVMIQYFLCDMLNELPNESGIPTFLGFFFCLFVFVCFFISLSLSLSLSPLLMQDQPKT